MNVQILNQIPESGSIDETRFDAVSDCKWYLFEDSDYCEWAGVFGNGCHGGTDVCMNPNGTAFVLAYGQGYIVNINTRQQLHKTQCDYLRAVTCSSESELFIATDDLYLYVYNCAGLIHETNRIALDGIEFFECKAGNVYGRLWGLNQWHDFIFNLAEKELKSSWVCGFD